MRGCGGDVVVEHASRHENHLTTKKSTIVRLNDSVQSYFTEGPAPRALFQFHTRLRRLSLSAPQGVPPIGRVACSVINLSLRLRRSRSNSNTSTHAPGARGLLNYAIRTPPPPQHRRMTMRTQITHRSQTTRHVTARLVLVDCTPERHVNPSRRACHLQRHG